ncbi:MAG TPA: glycine zipper 2TM domain-containing protein [Novosphingobium sp.]|nr:glycine zipper 2TM domain-containing protein [Novosphingobium sp.]
MNKLMLLPLAAAVLTTGCMTDRYGSRYAQNDYGYYDRDYYSQNGSYDYNRPDPRYGGYYADNYYRQDQRYRSRYLSNNDRVYRGRDGRYYCRRSDGSTGLVVGAVVGGIAGNLIAPGDSRTLGTILGAIGGAAAGAAIDSSSRDRTRCQ